MNKHQNYWAASLLLVSTILFSCHENEEVAPSKSLSDSDNFVSSDQATALAMVLEYPVKNSSGRTTGRIFKDVEGVLTVPDKKGKPAYYILNYEGGGYIMFSADKRTNSIRSFSTTGKFDFETKVLPGGLVSWLNETSDLVSGIREMNTTETEGATQSWAACPMQATVAMAEAPDGGCGPGGGGCEDTFTSVGPLLTTTWGQTMAYNDLVENINCSSGTTPTGCVATTMAQIMKYHQFPNNYNWGAMPNGSGSNETARLMRDIGTAVGMNYSCSSSGAASENAAAAFKNNFGYSNASYTGFNHNTIKQQIRSNRPVYLAAHSSSSCFLWWCSYQDGHAWVCDGYMSSFQCDTGASYLLLHMNWGWTQFSGTNGWYYYNRWNPGTYDFKYNKRMIYNIIP